MRTGAYQLLFSFHSIGFPSEWGRVNQPIQDRQQSKRFHSIGFPSEWGQNSLSRTHLYVLRFHSIGFPSEWGQGIREAGIWLAGSVSIQLVSPASGDLEVLTQQGDPQFPTCFHSIGFPSEWGLYISIFTFK